MPTRFARERAAERKKQHEWLDNAVEHPPSHLLHRLGKPSPILEAIKTKTEYLWGGFTYTEDGQPIKRSDLEIIVRENLKRQQQKMKKVAQVASEDPKLLNTRFGSSVIGRKILRHRDTVTRYKKLISIIT